MKTINYYFMFFVAFLAMSFQVKAVTPATIDFETVGNTWGWHVFANGAAQDPSNFSITSNPNTGGINTSANCAKLVVNGDASRWAGVWTTDNPFTVDDNNKIMKVMVYKSVISPFKISFLTANDQAKELDGLVLEATNTLINEWEVLTFDLSSVVGTTYAQMNIMPDFPSTARSQGSIDYWDNISFNTTITGLHKLDANTIEMFPNPVKDILHFQSKNIAKVVVRNLVGRTIDVNYINSSESSIDMNNLPAGSYFITLFMKDGNCTSQKVVKL